MAGRRQRRASRGRRRARSCSANTAAAAVTAPTDRSVRPSLEGLYGKPVPLQMAAIVTADERYIRDSILLPRRRSWPAIEPVMPTFQGQIERGRTVADHRLHQVAGRRKDGP